MNARTTVRWVSACAILLQPPGHAAAQDGPSRSFNAGILHPNGVNLIGYAVERQLGDELYWFYAFGVPTLAGIGLSWYANRAGDGPMATVGTSLGSYGYASIAYQIGLGRNRFLKLGAGVSAGFTYDASMHPVIAYEQRF